MSVRFAIAAFIAVALVSAMATIVDRPGIFRGPLFLVPAGLFTLSLLACTVDSLVRRPRRPLTGYAHDIIHVGVLILIAGGALTLLAAREDQVVMQIGDRVAIRGEWEIELRESIRTESNWESTLAIRRGGEPAGTRVVSVNNPVRIGGVRLLQQTWGESEGLVLEGAGGDRYVMMPGEGLSSDETTIILEPAPDAPLGLQFARYAGSERTGSVAVERGMEIAGLTVTGTERRVQSGLQVVHDPGAPIALAGAIVLIAGMGLYVMKKVREEKKLEENL
jgi:cytochrome c biogenesis protein ResB